MALIFLLTFNEMTFFFIKIRILGKGFFFFLILYLNKLINEICTKKKTCNILWPKKFPKIFSKQMSTYFHLKLIVKISALKNKTVKLLMKRKTFFEKRPSSNYNWMKGYPLPGLAKWGNINSVIPLTWAIPTAL